MIAKLLTLFVAIGCCGSGTTIECPVIHIDGATRAVLVVGAGQALTCMCTCHLGCRFSSPRGYKDLRGVARVARDVPETANGIPSST